MKFPVFDLHCDTALALLGNLQSPPKSLRHNTLHIDLERASALEGYAQCFACFTTNFENLPNNITVSQLFEQELEGIKQQIASNSDRIRLACNADDVRKNANKGLMSGILTIEGTAGIDFDPDMLPMLYKAGFRLTTLGWNEKNPLTGSHKTGGGLTEQGKAYVQQAQALGMVVDVSHISDEAFWDIMDITQKPIIASHSNSRAIHPVSRNLTDDMFCAICKIEGIVGINLYADFLGNEPTIDTVCDHIIHFLSLDPAGKHIALGGDLDGCDRLPDGFSGVQDYPLLAQKLLDRGLSEDTVYDIFWNNAIGVIERCCT